MKKKLYTKKQLNKFLKSLYKEKDFKNMENAKDLVALCRNDFCEEFTPSTHHEVANGVVCISFDRDTEHLSIVTTRYYDCYDDIPEEDSVSVQGIDLPLEELCLINSLTGILLKFISGVGR